MSPQARDRDTSPTRTPVRRTLAEELPRLGETIGSEISKHLGPILDRLTKAAIPPVVPKKDLLVDLMRARSKLSETEALPYPFDLSNEEVAKDPNMWVLYVSTTKATVDHLRDVHGAQGPLVLSFVHTLHALYDGIGITGSEIEALKNYFVLISLTYIIFPPALTESDKGVNLLMLSLRPMLDAATDLIIGLDSRVVTQGYSASAGDQYARGQRAMAPHHFPRAAQDMIKRLNKPTAAASKGGKSENKVTGKDGGGGGKALMCRKCGKEVSTSFKEHKLICKK